MAGTGLVLDTRFEGHDTGPSHPERPARLVAIREALGAAGLIDACRRIEPRPIALDKVHRLHSKTYVDRLKRACQDDLAYIDVVDSMICPASYDIGLLAAGAVVAAVEAVQSGSLRNGFCAVRPPGHHAERDMSLGFCLFNNIALAADHLIETHGLDRVFILDWDVHHCNGTQHTFERTDKVFVCSLHGHPNYVYPGTGFAEEKGVDQGAGFTLNLPMMPGATGDAYREAFVDGVLPAIEAYKPQFLLISAGFDAHRLDPLAPINLESSDFDWMTRWLMDAADRHCGGRVLSVLEGGYNLQALAESVCIHLNHLLHYRSDATSAGHESGAW